jgi:diguanylate cyclase (GGDEF)-like protein/PAS domain S-box-containing protein
LPPNSLPRTWLTPDLSNLIKANLLAGLAYALLVLLVSSVFPPLEHSVAAPIWPATAIATLAALIGGWRWMPGIALASWLGNTVFMHWSTEWALWITLGNVLGPMLSISLLRRLIPDVTLTLETGRGITLFCTLAVLNSMVSASFGSLAACMTHQLDAILSGAFLPWFVRDLTATLVLTPALLLWWRDSQTPCQLLRGNREMWLAATTLIILTMYLFFSTSSDVSSLLRSAIFLIMLPLVWVALRFPQRSTFTLMALVLTLATLGTWLGKGVQSEMAQPYTRLQIIMMTMSMVTLFVSAMSIERGRAWDALSESYATLDQRVTERTQQLTDNLKYLEMLLDGLPIPMVITRPDQSIVIYANIAAADYGGYSLNKMIGSSSTMYFHRLEDFQAIELKLKQEGSLSSHEVALRHRDGHTLWALLSAVPSRYNDALVMIFAFQDFSPAKQRELSLEQLVSTDTLTGVATRHHFIQRAEEVLRQSERNKQPFALLMLDLDHFKRVNDTHGHPAGDLVLRRVSETFRLSLRPGDICGRLGGEEFAVILSNTDINAAISNAERLRQKINALNITLDSGKSVNPSVSIGGVIFTPMMPDDAPVDGTRPQSVSIENMIEQADQCLYRAKDAGRNRVVFV